MSYRYRWLALASLLLGGCDKLWTTCYAEEDYSLSHAAAAPCEAGRQLPGGIRSGDVVEVAWSGGQRRLQLAGIVFDTGKAAELLVRVSDPGTDQLLWSTATRLRREDDATCGNIGFGPPDLAVPDGLAVDGRTVKLQVVVNPDWDPRPIYDLEVTLHEQDGDFRCLASTVAHVEPVVELVLEPCTPSREASDPIFVRDAQMDGDKLQLTAFRADAPLVAPLRACFYAIDDDISGLRLIVDTAPTDTSRLIEQPLSIDVTVLREVFPGELEAPITIEVVERGPRSVTFFL